MRWLLTSWGSKGDLHPFLALGRGLESRGHAVTLVGHPDWTVEAAEAGLRFVPTDEPPRGDILQRHPEIMSTQWSGLRGLRALVRHGIEPGFEPMLAALRSEAPHHDVVVAHHFVFSAPPAAELSGKPLVNVTLAPGVTPSAHSRPASHFGRAGTGVLARAGNRFFWQGGRFFTGLMVDPAVNRFRGRHGLAPVRGAVFDVPSCRFHLQLYSRHFAPPAPDWPVDRRPTGFCFYDPPSAKPLSRETEDFLARGEEPILFTLGSAAVQAPGDFYRVAVESLRSLGLRGILLIGPEENRPVGLSPEILALDYAPYGQLMPRVRAVVHQCGIGTLSHTLRAGRPSVACPFAFDQPNNASRLEELGVAVMVRPHERRSGFMLEALQRLLAGEAALKARQLGDRIAAEDGTARACEMLEREFSSPV